MAIAAQTVTVDIQQQQVTLALRPRLMRAYLGAVFGSPRHRENETPVCHILDMRYEPGQRCTILYQLDERMVLGQLHWNGVKGQGLDAGQRIAPLDMQTYLFPHDPALPGLTEALEPGAMIRLLNKNLPETGRVLRCRVTPLRYRPGRRCMLRIDLWRRNTQTGAVVAQTLFGKVYHDAAKAASVYEQMRLLSGSAPAGDGRITLARPVAFLPAVPLILQEPVAGTPLNLLLGRMAGQATTGSASGWRGVVRAAVALAGLHTITATSGPARPVSAELARFAQRAAKVAVVNPALGARLSELAAALPAWLECLPVWGAETGLVHGDCKPSQFLISPEQVALLDFDHCGLADPATDVATFMATLRQLGVRQRLKGHGSAAALARSQWLEALEGRFLAQYCDVSGYTRGFHWRVTWYEAVALLRKALRGFARSPFSPLPMGLVEEAWRCLALLPQPAVKACREIN